MEAQVVGSPRPFGYDSDGSGFSEPTTPKSVQSYRPSILMAGEAGPVGERLKAFLRACNFNVETQVNLETASQIARNHKLDGVFLFCGAGERQDLVHDLRASALNRSSMICAVVREKPSRSEAFRPGSNFTFDLPTFASNLQRYVKAMFGLVVKEHRRYFRASASVGVELVSSPMVSAECLDLSTTGIGLRLTPLTLSRREKVTLAVDFFDRRPPARIDSEVRWTEAGGKAGLSFLQMPVDTLERLQAWVEKSIEAAERLLGNKAVSRSV